MVNNEHIRNSELVYLPANLKPSMIRSLVDVGNLVDKLADVSLLDSKTRTHKWSRQTEEDNKNKEEHKRKSAYALSYSEFLYQSRQKNEIAYANIQNVSDPDIDFLLRDNLEDIIKKPPTFFTNLRFATLKVEEKRATIHKLQMIENKLPASTRKQIPILLHEVYQLECCADTSSNSCSGCWYCKTCCIS
jgi:hypothetical protein